MLENDFCKKERSQMTEKICSPITEDLWMRIISGLNCGLKVK